MTDNLSFLGHFVDFVNGSDWWTVRWTRTDPAMLSSARGEDIGFRGLDTDGHAA